MSTQAGASLGPLDTAYARSRFPAFADPDLRDWAHFENAGGSYVCRQVIDRLTGFYLRTKVQPDHPFPLSQAATEAMEHSYRRMAAWMGVGVDEIHFGPSTSQNTYVLARAFRSMWRDGDEIVASTQDHEANAGVWRRLEDTGIVVREWRVDPEKGTLDLADLDRLMTERTRLVAFPHASNVVAAINPVAEVVRRAAEVGARVVVDGVSYAPHGLPDLGSLGVDVYLFSAYKTWGPHQGVMYIRRDLAARLGNEGHYFVAEQPRYKLVPAGQDHAQVAACAGVIDYLDDLYAHHGGPSATPVERGRAVHDMFRAHETRLADRLLRYLAGRDDVRVAGPTDATRRAPTVSIVPLRRPVADVAESLVRSRMMVGVGDFYAPRLLDEMRIPTKPGVLRMSFIHYTTDDEIERLIDALDLALG
ncbi:aminotransferase class V-fold PLP-dependent enzyme [Candidatus Spongiisocius sp.]|uniref:aminotransferase class V-fold PLP-dependent enzyme n=1 Tax=Candidatus Spongiisocius sp. TaxID=3101273 RepID=UPI003B593CC8